MTEQLSELLVAHRRIAAEAAPWPDADILELRYGLNTRDAAHIASNDPAVVQAFVDVVEAVEFIHGITWDDFRVMARVMGASSHAADDYIAKVDRWQEHAEALKATADALRQQLASKHAKGGE